MDHFQAEMSFAHFPERAHALAGGQGFLLARIEMKKAQHELRFAFPQEAHQLPSAAILNLGVEDRALYLPRLPGPERAQGRQMRVILVAQRQMQDEILLARHTDARQLFLDRVAGLGFFRRRLLRGHRLGPVDRHYWPLLSSKKERSPRAVCAVTGRRISTPSISTRAPFGSAAT